MEFTLLQSSSCSLLHHQHTLPVHSLLPPFSSSSSFSFSSSSPPPPPPFISFPFSFPLHRSCSSSTRVSFARQSAPIPRRDISELTEYDDDDDDEDDDRKGDKEEEAGKEGKRSRSRRKQRHFSTEAEAKRHHWISRMWAPWEEALSPEAQFAVEALNLNQGDEPIVPMDMMNRLEVNEPIIPDNDDYLIDSNQEKSGKGQGNNEMDGFEEGAETRGRTSMAFSYIPPRDWPPTGWKVDPDELAFIRGIHSIVDKDTRTFDSLNVSGAVDFSEENHGQFARWEMFVKQYLEWVNANKSKLDQEAEEVSETLFVLFIVKIFIKRILLL